MGDPPHVGPECSQAPCGLCSTPCYSVAHITYVSNSQSLGEQRGFHSSVHGKIREQMTSPPHSKLIIPPTGLFSSSFPFLQSQFLKRKKKNSDPHFASIHQNKNLVGHRPPEPISLASSPSSHYGPPPGLCAPECPVTP